MKKVEDGFSTREVTCSLFSYSVGEFKKLKASKAASEWEEDLNDNSSSYPVLAGSPFDKKGLALSTSIDEEPQDDLVYVIPHYFYETADYAIEESIDKSFEIKLAPVVGRLITEGPMDWAEKGETQVFFEGQGSSDGTEFMINFYHKGRLIESTELSSLDDAMLKKIAGKL